MKYLGWYRTGVLVLSMLPATMALAKEPDFKYSDQAALRAKLLSDTPQELPYPATPLIDAVMRGFDDVVLLKLKDKKVRDEEGANAVIAIIQIRRTDMLRMVLAEGISPNAMAEGQWYALGEAAKEGSVSTMCLLLDYGANPALRNTKVGNLMMALVRRHLDTAALLMRAGYVPSDDEVEHVRLMGQKAGLASLYAEILKIKADKAALQQQCQDDQPTLHVGAAVP
ncbi:MAG TPA: ankyrin repeat domain-containing protein [Dyella sp.]|uniref:ankyrin repeat domain-containing protein n=1 Tax=Dyella sp. TaxID=1869338 RepID=UPI002F934F23